MTFKEYVESRRDEVRRGLGAVSELVARPERVAWIAVAIGVALRIAEYAYNRSFWLDEQYLADGIVGWTVFDLHPLPHGQLAPPGFLFVERAACLLLGGSRYALRLVPMLGGLSAMALMPLVARRYVSPAAVLVATALFALTDYQLYFSCELKQYSWDMAMGLACLLIPSLLAGGRGAAARWAAATALGAVAVWMSNPAVFVLAGVGAYLLADAIRRRQWARARAVAALGVAWLASFAGSFLVSQAIIEPDTVLWLWWDFAFLPLPPTSANDLLRLGRHLLNLFTNPLALDSPLGPRLTAFVGAALAVVGAWTLARRHPGRLWLLVAPLLAALAAAGAHRYPFHSRVVLFLVPPLLLLVSEGASALGRLAGRPALVLLVACLLVLPVLEIDRSLGTGRRTYEPHGDIRQDIFTTDEFYGKPPVDRGHGRIATPGSRRVDAP